MVFVIFDSIKIKWSKTLKIVTPIVLACLGQNDKKEIYIF